MSEHLARQALTKALESLPRFCWDENDLRLVVDVAIQVVTAAYNVDGLQERVAELTESLAEIEDALCWFEGEQQTLDIEVKSGVL